MAKKKRKSRQKSQLDKQNPELSDVQKEVPLKDGQNLPKKPANYQPLFLVLLVVAGIVVYANTLQAPFTFDDYGAIVENHSIRMTELSGRDMINGAVGWSKNRPVSMLSFALNYYVGEYNVIGYHLVNTIIHIINAILLFFFLKTTLLISQNRKFIGGNLDSLTAAAISFFAAFIWLVHPLQTNSVTYIVQRMNSMGTMFYILALLLYVAGRLEQRKAHYGPDSSAPNGGTKGVFNYCYFLFSGCALASVLAFGSKESTLALPFFIFLYEWYFFQNLSGNWLKNQLKYIIAVIVLLIIVAAIYLGIEPVAKIKDLRDFSEGQFTLDQRLLTQARVLIYYLSLIFYPNPSRLNLDYDFPLSISLIDPFTTLFSVFAITGLIIVGVYLGKRQPLISFCILWFFGNLVIESSVIPLAIIFEHRLYLPSMLVSLLLVVLFHRYIKPRWLSVGIPCSLILLLSYWTFERNSIWQDEISLWSDTIKKSPNKARPYSNLGSALTERKRYDEALPNFLKALQLSPDFIEAHYNLGVLMGKQDKTEEAIKYYRNAVQLNPGHFKAHNNLGLILAKQENIIAAEEHYLKALQINPDFAKAHNNLGLLLAEQEKLDEAIEHYHLALQINPDYAEAHFNLGLVLEKQGKKDEAEGHYLKSQQSNPNLAELQNKLGLVSAKQGRFDEANEHYRKALQINPDFAEAYVNLGDALVKQGKTEEAITQYQKAVQIDPGHAEALNNLGGQLLQRGEIDEALTHFNAVLKINPDMPQAHNNIGIIMINKGKINEAIFHFQEAVRINPEFELAQNNLRKALDIRQSQMDTELEKIRAALKNNPDDPQLNYELGNLYLGKGKIDKAIAQFRKTLSIQPNFPEALNNLAMAFTFSRQYDQALEVFDKLIALQPDNPANYYNVAVLQALLNNVSDSLGWLNKAVAKGYDNWDLIKTDKDLENIRNSEGYRELVKGR